MGEGPDLTDDEWPVLLDTVVKTADGRGTVFCALKTKATLQTIDDAKRAQDLGAVGLQIDLPIFHHPTRTTWSATSHGHLGGDRRRHPRLQHVVVR